jgi:hypothetical protein
MIRGPQLDKRARRSFCLPRRIQVKMCLTHYIQTDELSKRSIQTIKMKVRLVSPVGNIKSAINKVVLERNNMPHTATSFSQLTLMTPFIESYHDETNKMNLSARKLHTPRYRNIT